MAFIQDPPRLGNQYDDDPMLGDFLTRVLDAAELAVIEPELRELGDLAGGHFHALSLADRTNEPVLTQWDPWGRRIDHIEVSPLWKEAARLAAERGLVAAGYEAPFGARARLHQFALVHVIGPSLDVYTCPLAMTDGAVRTLVDSGNRELADRALPRLLSRDPATAWTSGQWMTERTGGSDVGLSETVAHRDGDGGWRLTGTKWFTSATTAEMALTLARPAGNPAGSRGLALFYVPVRADDGGLAPGISVNRLKDKLGTRKVPTAELTLDGARAILVGEEGDGVRAITPMLSITRTWNAVCSVAGMRRALALARDFADRRRAFGALLRDKPLHADTLAGLEAEYAAAFLLAFRAVTVLGKVERGAADDQEQRLLRALTPIAKLTTAKQAVAVASEAIESCGGAGYVEDTGLPRLLADAQVLPIWEGTTNVLSLDTLRALGKGGAIEAVVADARAHLGQVSDGGLTRAAATARDALDHAVAWAAGAMNDAPRLEAGARRVAMTLGRSLELAYLCAHAQWCLDHGQGGYAAAAARRFARAGIDLVDDLDGADTRALLR
ncbi:MAG: acyl-CoA dehydrogenase family protein [Kofleriaceae bacterium]|nr:acyl-CoA dehydrogenase family protein [Kofleriaceae bacterium]MCL4226897.1 acyl-CoA dehydrogenase family protein [Myxococcales bacterium]